LTEIGIKAKLCHLYCRRGCGAI